MVRPARAVVTIPWVLLGWHDAETMVVWSDGLVELSLRDGHRANLARFARWDMCEVPHFTTCQIFGMVAATGLLPSMRVVPAKSPIRRRWSLRWPLIGVVVALGLAAQVAVVLGDG